MPALSVKIVCSSAAACFWLTVLWSSVAGAVSLGFPAAHDYADRMKANPRGDGALPGFPIPTHDPSAYMSSCASCDAPRQPSAGDGSSGRDGGNLCTFDLSSTAMAGVDTVARSRRLTEESMNSRSMRVSLRHRDDALDSRGDRKESFLQALQRDSARIHRIHTRSEAMNEAKMAAAGDGGGDDHLPLPRHLPRPARMAMEKSLSLESRVESGASLGAGEYFVDFFMGSPPRRLSLIIDTGSDLTWLQCSPCEDCYEQEDPLFDPTASSSFSAISCTSPACQLVYPPSPNYCLPQDPPPTCSYLYWYGDNSSTSGTLATETVTIAATNKTTLQIRNVIFGCGTANRGLFHGAGGLLGLGQGPLSFSSQLRSILGHKFSYCLVDRNQNTTVSSTLIFGEDDSIAAHPDLQYIPFAKPMNSMDATFYYVRVVAMLVAGEALPIPAEIWEIDENGYGGTIFDSGTTLTYLPQPAYQILKAAFESRLPYPKAAILPPLLDLCYNLTDIHDPSFPELGIVFEGGIVMNFSMANYIVQPDPEKSVLCLAIQPTKPSSLSIIGNLQQQNFHILYDRENSRIGFAPMMCASL